MAGPVRQPVKRGPVIPGSILERLLRGKMNTVARAVVKRLVGLIVIDPGTGIFENLLPGIHDFEGSWAPRLVFRDTVYLLCVEDRVYPVDQPRLAPVLSVPVGTVSGVLT